jgi:hypothetical protein
MRRVLVCAVTAVMLSAAACRGDAPASPPPSSPPADTQKPADPQKPAATADVVPKDALPGLPLLTDFPPAPQSCGRKVNVSPWVGTPAVEWPKTFHCVLTVHTCGGLRTYRSDVRPGGTGMCDDYWTVHKALANVEICCGQPASSSDAK